MPRVASFASLLFGCSLIVLRCAGTAGKEPLQQGFDAMYNLAFPAAHEIFRQWESIHPDDPRGPVFDAAAYLFAEFDRKRILQSEFFLDNAHFREHEEVTVDTLTRKKFYAALEQGNELSDSILSKSPDDQIALFAKVVAEGLEADYEALIEKHDVRAFLTIKTARQTAQKLLSSHPNCYDAHLAAGVESYLLSQKVAPVRWMLHLTGAETDKQKGISELRIVAEKGNYLQPYAELLLAVAALRDNNRAEACRLLHDLALRYPSNRLYKDELRKIGS